MAMVTRFMFFLTMRFNDCCSLVSSEVQLSTTIDIWRSQYEFHVLINSRYQRPPSQLFDDCFRRLFIVTIIFPLRFFFNFVSVPFSVVELERLLFTSHNLPGVYYPTVMTSTFHVIYVINHRDCYLFKSWNNSR